jgi:hypothetical protein
VPNDKRTRLELTTNNATADGVDTDRITAFTFDRYGNPVDTRIRSASLDSQVTVQSNIADTGADGATTIDYTSLTEGPHQVSVDFWREGVWDVITFKPQSGSTPPANYASSPATISFGGGACSPANSSFTVDKLTATVGTNVLFTITLRDENNNTCTDVAPTLSVGGNAVIGTVTAGGTAGVYTATVTDQKAETVDVAVMVNSEEVAHHTGLATANPQPITFTPDDWTHECTPPGGSPQPGTRIAIDNDQIAAVDEGNHVVTATVVDRFCNPIPGKSVYWATQAGLMADPASKTSVTDAAGQAVLTVTATVPGDYDVTAKAGDTESSARDIVNGSPAVAKFGVGACSAIQSSFTVDEVEVAKGSTVTFTIVLKDTYGNTCTDAIPTLNVNMSAIASAAQPTATPGTYTATVFDALAQTVNVDVRVSGVPVVSFTAPATANPQPIRFLPINPTIPVVRQDRDPDGTPILIGGPSDSSEPGNIVTIVWPGGTAEDAGVVAVNPDGTWRIPIPPGTPDGSAMAVETTTDGGISAAAFVPIDITPPPTPAGHQEKQGNAQVITNNPGALGEPGSTITVTWPDHTTGTVVVDSNGNWTIPIPNGMADGNAAVVARDGRGNATPSVNIPIDVTAPDAPDSGHQEQLPDGTQVVTNEPDNDAEPGTTIVITWPDDTTDTVVVDDDGGWTIEIPPGMEDGDATVVAVDPDGNTSPEITIPIDVTPPPNPGGHQEHRPDGTQVITNDRPGEPGSTIVITWPDDTTSSTVVDGGGNWTVVIPPGMHEVGQATVVARDPEGNTTPEIKIPVDVTPPPNPAPAQGRDDDDRPILTDDHLPHFEPEPGSTITVTWPDGTTSNVVVDGDGNWSIPIPVPMPDGNASVIATDRDGNVAGPVTVPIDVTPPVPPRAEQNGDMLTNAPGTKSEPGATIIVVWPDGSKSVPVRVEADGSWAVPIPPGTDGEASVIAVDLKGNASGPVVVFIVPPMVLIEPVEVTTPQDTPVYLPVLEKVTGGSNTIPKALQSHTLPAHGTITDMNGVPTNNLDLSVVGASGIMHSPNKGFYGDDYLTVTVHDGYGHTLAVPVHVIVLAAPPPAVKTGGELISAAGLGWAVGACALAGIAMLTIALTIRRRRKAE